MPVSRIGELVVIVEHRKESEQHSLLEVLVHVYILIIPLFTNWSRKVVITVTFRWIEVRLR